MSVDLENERIAWTDVESTGLSPWRGSKLLQVAIIITDGNFNQIATHESKIKVSKEVAQEYKESADPYVQEMHTATGLWGKLSDEENIPLEDWDNHVHSWMLEHLPKAGVARMGGNSITLDRNHLEVYLPKVADHFSYRNLDMTSVEYFLGLTRAHGDFEKNKTHNALDDIRESINQAKYHRTLVTKF